MIWIYLIDITRINKNDISTDLLADNYSFNARKKAINYLSEYAYVNYDLMVDKEILDNHLNNDIFSFKNFMREVYKKDVDDDLLMVSFTLDKDKYSFIKYFFKDNNYPIIVPYKKKDSNNIKDIMMFNINEYLVGLYSDNLDMYNKEKVTKNDLISNTYYNNNLYCKTYDINESLSLNNVDINAVAM